MLNFTAILSRTTRRRFYFTIALGNSMVGNTPCHLSNRHTVNTAFKCEQRTTSFFHSRNYTSGYSTLRRQPNPCLKFQRQTVTTTINAAALNLVEVSGTDKRYGLLLDREAGANLVTVAVRCTLCSPSTVRIFFLLFDDAFFIYEISLYYLLHCTTNVFEIHGRISLLFIDLLCSA